MNDLLRSQVDLADALRKVLHIASQYGLDELVSSYKAMQETNRLNTAKVVEWSKPDPEES